MAQDINELRKLLAELNTLRVQLNKNPLGEEGLGKARKSASAMARAIEDMKNQLDDLDGGFGGLSEAIREIAREWQTGFADPVKEATKSMTKLKGLADKFSEDARGIAEMKGKEVFESKRLLKIEIDRLRQTKKDLEQQAKKLGSVKKLSTKQQTILANLESEYKVQEELLDKVEERAKLEEKIQKNMGLTGAAVKGITGALGKLGIHSKFFEGVEDNMRKTAKSGGMFKTALTGIKGIAGGIGQALRDPLVVLGLLVKAVKFLYESLTFAKNESLAVAKATSGMLSKDFMQNLTNASNGMTLMMEDSLKASDELRKNLGFLPSQIDKSAKEGKALVQEIHTLTEAFGLSGQEASNVYSILQSSDIPVRNVYKELDKAAVELERSSGYAVDTQASMKVLSSSSAIVRNNMRGNAQELIKAASNAALMRMSLDDVRNAAESTLDFQGSIRKEMEAEMFLQKDLNLDAYRFAAATGDAAGQAEELQKLIKQNYKGLKGNTFAQQAFADATGISREQLAESIDNIELQNKLGAVTNDQVKYYNQLLAQGVSEEKAKARIQEMGAEGVRKAFEEQQNQANRIAKIQERFKQAVAGLAESLEGVIEGVANFFSSPGGKLFAKIAAMAIGGVLVIKAGKSLLNLFTGGMFQKGSRMDPMYTWNLNEQGGGGGDMIDNVVGRLGSRWTRSMKWTKNISKVFGGKNTYMGRQLRNLSAMFGKRSSFINQVVKNNSTLSKIFPKLSTLNSKLPQDIAMNIGKTLRVDKAGNVIRMADAAADTASAASKTSWISRILPKGLTTTLSKVGPVLTKGLKALGPIGAVADLAIGGYTGYQQSQMSAEEQRAAGVKEGISATEATVQGVLTGGAEKGSVITDWFGGEKGSAGDELLGIGTSAARGALAGAAIGSVVPVVGTAIGGAVGAVVGTVAEGFKVFSDPNSSLRKGLSDGIDWMGEKLSGAWDTVSEWGSDIGNWASDTWSSVSEGFGNFTDSVMSIGSDLLSSAGDMASDAYDWASEGLSSLGSSISSGLSSAWDTATGWFGFANGGIAPGGFQAFANGGMVTQPTIGMVGEGQYNEAIVPLPDGKSIPVQMASGGSNETVTLLKELIAVVRQGGDIIIDGKKVGEAIAMTTSRMG